MTDNPSSAYHKKPVRKTLVRGMGVVFSPLLTIVIFVWVLSMTNDYLFEPLTASIQFGIYQSTNITLSEDAVEEELGLQIDDDKNEVITFNNVKFHRTSDKRYIPLEVFELVEANCSNIHVHKDTARNIYLAYIRYEYLQWYYTVPAFVLLLVVVLYIIGKLMAAKIGQLFWRGFEKLIHQLPLVRVVYSSVQQIADFLFKERDIEFNRVVAVEYPRKGIYSLGFVTGDSLRDISTAANEPVMSVLMPTSPMPMTGFTVTIRQSETIDLNITVDQALQFVISCGVVVPAQQLINLAADPEEALDKIVESVTTTEDDAADDEKEEKAIDVEVNDEQGADEQKS